MICPKCDTDMESMGYGDEQCPKCGHNEYSESERDFEARMYPVRLEPYPVPEAGNAFIERAQKAARPFTFTALKPNNLSDIYLDEEDDNATHDLVRRVAYKVKQEGGKLFIVGGFVRDALLRLNNKDIDVEVFGLTADQLKAILSKEGEVDCIGESFGVFIIKGHEVDWSLPRRDSKSGRGHRGIDVHTDPNLSYEEAAKRRDLTINAIMWDPLDTEAEELIDPFDGRGDLRKGILRAVDKESFSDDPLRGLRAVRMAAVYGFLPDDELIELMGQQDLSELSSERLWGEWEKIASKGRLPSLAFMCLENSGLVKYFPELEALQDVQQDPEWHPEGDVYVHTAMVMDRAAQMYAGHDQLALMFGALCHDLGKAPTTKFENGRWRAKAHDTEGIPLTVDFMTRINSPHDLIDQVCALVEHHLKPATFVKDGAGSGAYRRLAKKCDGKITMRLLSQVAEADHRGRTTDQADEKLSYINVFCDKATNLKVINEAPQSVVMGRDLLALGHKPGPNMGVVLKECLDYQLEHGATDKDVILSAVLDEN